MRYCNYCSKGSRKQRGGKVLRGNAIAARARNKLFQLMARLLHVQAFTCTIWFYNIIIINTNRNNGNREQPLEILGKS